MNMTIIWLGLSFVAGLVIQILSILRLIRFLTTSKKAYVGLSLVTFLLSIIYKHEVVAMLSNYWAYPALGLECFSTNMDY